MPRTVYKIHPVLSPMRPHRMKIHGSAVKALRRKGGKKGQNKSLTVEGEDQHKRHRHVTIFPIDRSVTNKDGAELTKIELELEEAPDNKEQQQQQQQDNQLPTIFVGSLSTELDPTVETNLTYPHGFPGPPGVVVVRAEEALIVVFVLVLWVAAIALFFNRWGKIRMLEPYQPKFQQQHRPSCAIPDTTTLPLRACSKFNIHCLEHPLYPSGESQRPRQNSVFVGSSISLLPNDQGTPRRAKSAFDLQSLVMAECTVQNPMSENMNEDTLMIESEVEFLPFAMVNSTSNRRLRPFNEFPKPSRSFQRERGASICHFDRTDVLARPLQRERGMSICHFDRMDVLARPLRDRGSSICHFDRMDVLARPSFYRGSRASIVSNADKLENLGRSLQRESRTNSIFNGSIDKPHVACSEALQRFSVAPASIRDSRLNVAALETRSENITRFLQRESRASLGNNERGAMIENLDAGKKGSAGQSAGNIGITTRDRATVLGPYDRPSCSKTPDVVLGYEATCV